MRPSSTATLTAPDPMPDLGPDPAPAAKPAVRFTERGLQTEILDLLAAKKSDRATRVLIDQLAQLQDASLNIKEKLNLLLFLTRAIQDGGGSKYGHAKLRTKIRTLTGIVRDQPLPPGGFIELGCGAHDPIALSTYFYLNGLTPACGIDLLPPRSDHFSGLSMYDILANMRTFPGRYVMKGAKPGELLTRLRTVDIAAFERGDFAAGLESFAGEVRLIAEDFRTCDIATGSIALLTSFAVLEHVDDLGAIARRSYDLLAPGGLAYHFVDLADHRSYRGDGAIGPLAFLTEAEAPANMNRLRAPEMTEAMRAAGFEVIHDKRTAAPIDAKTRAALIPRFAAMDMDDVAVIKQNLLLRKPG